MKANPENESIYGQETIDESLINSIRDIGVLEAVYIKNDNTLVSGHRRWRAAQAIQDREVLIPAIRVTYANKDEEVESIIEHNRQREKTLSQLAQEGLRLEPIYARKAKERQSTSEEGVYGGKPLPEMFPEGVQGETHDQVAEAIGKGETRDQVAEAIGIGSGKQWEKLKEVHNAAQSGDQEAKKKMGQQARRPNLNKIHNQVRDKVKQKQQEEDIKATVLPAGQFQVIVVDPPWQYDSRASDPTHRGRLPYKSMSMEELEALEIPAADNSIMWLWVTNSFLHQALHLLDQWGFEYKTMLTWAKPSIGLGDWLRGQTEHCLLGVKGNYRISPKGISTLLQAPTGRHSEKPDDFYALVDGLCVGTRIDMFARKEREGWDTWGSEVPKS